MISFDVTALAGELIMGSDQLFSVKETLTVRMIEAAVDILNEPGRRDSILDSLSWVMEDSYALQTPDLTMERYVSHIAKQMKAHGWDERLKVKLVFKKLGNNYHRAIVEMDLDATISSNNDRRKKPRLKPDVAEIVSDNPSLESINEFFDRTDKRPSRKSPVLSDRLGRTVNDPTGRGW